MQMYTIRNVNLKTREAISKYAEEYGITVGDALEQLVEFGLEYFDQQKKNPKKYLNTQGAIKNLPCW